MNAIQFIKENGVEKAREVVEGAPANARYFETYPLRVRYYISDIGCNRAISISEIKRLVEGMDLVNCNGGWNGTKNTITLFQSSLDLGLHHGVDGVEIAL